MVFYKRLDIDERASRLDPVERLLLRRRESASLMKRMEVVIHSPSAMKLLPKSKLGQAVSYWLGKEMFTDAMLIELESRHSIDSVDAREFYQWSLENWYDSGGEEDGGRFEIQFAPDALHKVNVSGGGPYGRLVPDNNVDGIVHINNRRIYFVDYLRECLQWGGFPGFANIEKGRDRGEIACLTKGLIPI